MADDQNGNPAEESISSRLHDEDDDFDLRYQVVETGFSESDERLYETSMDAIRKMVEAGVQWDLIENRLEIPDSDLKQIILDDFIKIVLARNHFQEGKRLKSISKELRIAMERLVTAKNEMIEEVKQASIKAYHVTQKKQNNDPSLH
ncbi:MAG: hypothetical protein HQL50_12665 [Magnetococcales bacterium]|nr:hypothetical protein [Magnetococcales bacterium]